MSWQEDHQRFLDTLPPQIREAHRHSTGHRTEIVASARCGCFHCCSTFPPSEIEEWIDAGGAGEGQTALCPKCGIDSVLGDRAGFDLSEAFLSAMRAHWFGA